MFAKRLLLILFLIIAAIFLGSICFAAGDAMLSQVYSRDESIDVFIKGNINPDNINCMVSNQKAEVVGSGLLADVGITIRTTVLIDISKSIPSGARKNVKSFVNSLIENIGKNEQFKIVTFGEQLNILQDFSANHNDLANVIKKIEFIGQNSILYDAIFNTIPAVQPIDGSPCYYRTIVITDGVDDTVSGVTKEELYLRLQKETYPIDVAAVSTAKQPEPNKELSALTRISGGQYYNLYSEADSSSLANNLGVNNILWIQATIPEKLLDGSIRQVNIDDGVNSVQFDTKISVLDIPITESQTTVSEQTTISEQATTLGQPAISGQTTASEQAGSNTLFNKYPMIIYIGSACGIIVIALVIIIMITRFRSKTERSSKFGSNNQNANPSFNDKTELLSNFAFENSGGNPCIRLRNLNNSDQAWKISLSKDVIIGRDTNCQVCIADNSVSHQQCKLYISTVPTVENLSNSNKTQLNGKLINSPTRLQVGDKLKCGRVTLLVDSLYGSDSHNIGELNKGTMFINI